MLLCWLLRNKWQTNWLSTVNVWVTSLSFRQSTKSNLRVKERPQAYGSRGWGPQSQRWHSRARASHSRLTTYYLHTGSRERVRGGKAVNPKNLHLVKWCTSSQRDTPTKGSIISPNSNPNRRPSVQIHQPMWVISQLKEPACSLAPHRFVASHNVKCG